MRTLSASEAKGRSKAHNNLIPKPNTKLRQVYDLLQNNKGRVVDTSELDRTAKQYLSGILPDYYGLDIRRMAKHRHCLVGEWFGRQYVDYVAERLAAKRIRKFVQRKKMP